MKELTDYIREQYDSELLKSSLSLYIALEFETSLLSNIINERLGELKNARNICEDLVFYILDSQYYDKSFDDKATYECKGFFCDNIIIDSINKSDDIMMEYSCIKSKDVHKRYKNSSDMSLKKFVGYKSLKFKKKFNQLVPKIIFDIISKQGKTKDIIKENNHLTDFSMNHYDR